MASSKNKEETTNKREPGGSGSTSKNKKSGAETVNVDISPRQDEGQVKRTRVDTVNIEQELDDHRQDQIKLNKAQKYYILRYILACHIHLTAKLQIEQVLTTPCSRMSISPNKSQVFSALYMLAWCRVLSTRGI